MVMGGQREPDGAGTEVGSAFVRDRSLLVGVAYRMLGSVSDAEDVVQEAWLRWARVDADTVHDPTAFLVRTVTRLAIDRLRRVKARRESYVGPWLPEPLLTGQPAADPAEDADRAESVSMAMLVVLETLSPLERSVFVLHEAFALLLRRHRRDPGPEPGRGAPARAPGPGARAGAAAALRDRSGQAPGRHRAVPARQRPRVTWPRLLELLAPDAILWADGGGKAKAPLRPIHGRDKIARFFVGISGRAVPAGGGVQIVEVNGGPAVVLHTATGPFAAGMVDLDPDTGLISVIRLIASPDKMAGLAALEQDVRPS